MGENDSMLTMFVLENSQLLEQLEELLLGGEKNEKLGKEQIDETFRVMPVSYTHLFADKGRNGTLF